jgi:tetratricopeptide (TPR) repeat protein
VVPPPSTRTVAVAASKHAPPHAWRRVALAAGASLLLLLLFTGEIRDTDVWLHLKTGEHTLRTRALTVPDPFSYTSGTAVQYAGEAAVRYFNLTHEWLSQVLMYLLYRTAGFPGLVAARALLLMLFCGLIGWMAFHRSRDFPLSVAASLMAAGMAFHFQQSRPFLVTFVCLALTMAILESGRLLWLLPPLFMLWANCHAGFFLGWLVLAAWCADALIGRMRRKPVPKERNLWLAALGSLAASAVNPNGWRVLEVLLLYRSSGIQMDNLEWQRPIFWEPGIYSFLLFCPLIVLLLAWRRTRPVDWLLYAGFAALSLTAVRNTIFIGLAGPVLIAAYLPKRRWIAIPALALTAATLLYYDVRPAAASGNVLAFRAAEWQLPTGAADFIQQHRIADRMFNPYETGGYLMWRLWPLQRDFIDPRGLSEEAYTDYRNILANTDGAGGKSAEKLLRKYGIEMIVMDGFDYLGGQVYPLAAELARSPAAGWKLAFADSASFVFLRRLPAGIHPLDSVPALLAGLEQQCESHVQHDPRHPRCARGLAEFHSVLGNPAKAEQWMAWYLKRRVEPDPEAERIYNSLRVTGLNEKALALESQGDLAGAEPLFRSAVALAEGTLGPNHQDTAGSLNNLAGLLEAKGDYAAAEPLYRRALAIAEITMGPEDPRVATSLDNLAGLLVSRGDYAGAEPLYVRALAIAERALGPNDPETQSIRDDLANLRRAAGGGTGRTGR